MLARVPTLPNLTAEECVRAAADTVSALHGWYTRAIERVGTAVAADMALDRYKADGTLPEALAQHPPLSEVAAAMAHVCVCVRESMCVCMHACMHVCMHACMYVCMYGMHACMLHRSRSPCQTCAQRNGTRCTYP